MFVILMGVLQISEYTSLAKTKEISISLEVKILMSLCFAIAASAFALWDVFRAHKKKGLKPLYTNQMEFVLNCPFDLVKKKLSLWKEDYHLIRETPDVVFLRKEELHDFIKFPETIIPSTEVLLKHMNNEKTHVKIKLSRVLNFIDYNGGLYAVKSEIENICTNSDC